MKSLFNLVIVSVLALLGFSAQQAQAQAPFTLFFTNQVVAENAGTNLNLYIDVRHQDVVSVLISANNMVTGTTSNLTAYFFPAMDQSGTRDSTNLGALTAVLAATGLTKNQVITNLSVAGYPYLKLQKLINTNLATAQAMSNITIGYATKQLGRAP